MATQHAARASWCALALALAAIVGAGAESGDSTPECAAAAAANANGHGPACAATAGPGPSRDAGPLELHVPVVDFGRWFGGGTEERAAVAAAFGAGFASHGFVVAINTPGMASVQPLREAAKAFFHLGTEQKLRCVRACVRACVAVCARLPACTRTTLHGGPAQGRLGGGGGRRTGRQRNRG